MLRLFVAIPPPPAVREALALARGGIEGARWLDPSDYHITLRFIGDVDAADADRVAEELSRIEATPFSLRLTEYAAFGGELPRLLYLGVEPCRELVALQRSCEMACRAAGMEAESRKYTPHITLARIAKRGSAGVAPWLAQRSYGGPIAFEASVFSLYTARPGGGTPYDRAVDYPLGNDTGSGAK